MRNVAIALISVITIASILTIYTTFKMSYQERVRELGMLSSIGMNKKQRRNMLLKETLVIATIGIVLGILVGIILSYFEVQILDYFISRSTEMTGVTLIINPNVKLYMKISILGLALAIGIAYIISVISAMLPMRKLNKISPIDAIKQNENSHIKAKQMKAPKIVKKIFGQEGVLAYKNIRKDKSRYKTIVLSMVVSIILFIMVDNVLLSMNKMNEPINDLSISVSSVDENKYEENLLKVMNELKDKKLIDKYVASMTTTSVTSPGGTREVMIVMPKGKLTEETKKIAKTGYSSQYYELGEEVYMNVTIVYEFGRGYDILDKGEIDKLEDGECIVLNNIQGTKNKKNSQIADYNQGDDLKIIVTSRDLRNEVVSNIDEEQLKKEQEMLNSIMAEAGITNTNVEKTQNSIELEDAEYNFKVKSVINKSNDEVGVSYGQIEILVNKNTFEKIYKENMKGLNTENVNSTYYSVDASSDTPYEAEDELNAMNERMGDDVKIYCYNFYDGFMSIKNFNKIEETVVYSFITFIALFSAVNIFNTITSSVILRKREFAMLKSLGMDEKKIGKMLFLEGIFYGLDAIIYGFLISTVLLYLRYLSDEYARNMQVFAIPWVDYAISIVVVYIMIFSALHSAKKKIENNNIVEVLRNENI